MDDGEGRQRRRQQPRPLPINPPPDDEHHPHGGRIRQGGQRAPGEAQVQRPRVGKGFGHGADQNQRINQNAAQGEPVRVERAAFRRQRRCDVGQSGLHLRPLGQPALVARRLCQRPEHIIRAQVEGTLVGMEPVPCVPVNAVKTQPQRRQQQRRQKQARPPPPAPAPTTYESGGQGGSGYARKQGCRPVQQAPPSPATRQHKSAVRQE